MATTLNLVGAGHVLDLRERELAIVVEDRKSPNTVPMLDARPADGATAPAP